MFAAAAFALSAATLIAPHAAQAAPYWPWCVRTADRNSTQYCGFISWEQCMETARGGRGGYCYHNLEAPPVADRSASRRRSNTRN
jgi:hypothetical protein